MSSRSRSKGTNSKSVPLSSRGSSASASNTTTSNTTVAADADADSHTTPSAPAQPSAAGLGLWRAIAGELSKLSTVQTAIEDTARGAINESTMSGVLAVYDVEGNRVINDYIFKPAGVSSSGGGSGEKELEKAKKELEKLKDAYELNRDRLAREKKALEQIIGPLKKLVGDAAAGSNTGSGGSTQPGLQQGGLSGGDRKRRFDEVTGANDSSSGASASPATIPSSGKTNTKRGKPNPSSSSSASASSAVDPASSGTTAIGTHSPPLAIGDQVAFRLHSTTTGTSGSAGDNDEEEWIQCEVTKLFSDGQRYEVRDPEPDEHGHPGQSYKASYRDLIRIPSAAAGASLPAYPAGAKVLARYPETTTFYRAEVVSTRRDGKCRLKFVGEEDEGKEQEVERRVVLPIPVHQQGR